MTATTLPYSIRGNKPSLYVGEPYILNSLYVSTNNEAEKAFIASLSPGAWGHINLLGYYQFCGQFRHELVDHWIKQWDWRKFL